MDIQRVQRKSMSFEDVIEPRKVWIAVGKLGGTSRKDTDHSQTEFWNIAKFVSERLNSCSKPAQFRRVYENPTVNGFLNNNLATIYFSLLDVSTIAFGLFQGNTACILQQSKLVARFDQTEKVVNYWTQPFMVDTTIISWTFSVVWMVFRKFWKGRKILGTTILIPYPMKASKANSIARTAGKI